MREIKFRYIWQKPDGTIIKHEYTLEEIEKKDLAYIEADSLASDWKLLAKLQYTNLKDKNRVEIYEEDILKTEYTETTGIREIKYRVTDESSGFGFIQNLNSSEVIGNIYENKELLK